MIRGGSSEVRYSLIFVPTLTQDLYLTYYVSLTYESTGLSGPKQGPSPVYFFGFFFFVKPTPQSFLIQVYNGKGELVTDWKPSIEMVGKVGGKHL